MKTLALLIALAVAVMVIVPKPTKVRSLPTRAVAPEVCEHEGAVVKVQDTGRLLYVTCHSGLVALVQNVHGDSYVMDRGVDPVQP